MIETMVLIPFEFEEVSQSKKSSLQKLVVRIVEYLSEKKDRKDNTHDQFVGGDRMQPRRLHSGHPVNSEKARCVFEKKSR